MTLHHVYDKPEGTNAAKRLIKLSHGIVPLNYMILLNIADSMGSINDIETEDSIYDKEMKLINDVSCLRCYQKPYSFIDKSQLIRNFIDYTGEVINDRNDFCVYILCGFPGCGKSTYYREFLADANSESDYDNKSITIVSGYIDDYIAPDFLSNICHEVNHLYEYDNGREKRVDLYNKVRELIAMKNNDAYIVGNAFYYSFQHEIDAFVHQFYGFLKQEKPNHLNFEQLLNYSEYINALSAYKFVYNKRNDKKVMNWINYLGYDRKSYFKRLKYGLKKLFTKIKNAYLRYKLENRQMTEGVIHRLQNNEKIRLEECKKYNQDITWGIEIIYNF